MYCNYSLTGNYLQNSTSANHPTDSDKCAAQSGDGVCEPLAHFHSLNYIESLTSKIVSARKQEILKRALQLAIHYAYSNGVI